MVVFSFNLPNSKLITLYSLHVLNDGYYSGILLFLPFIAKDLNINLAQAGFLASLINIVTIFIALPSGYISAKVGSYRTLFIGLLIYASCYLLLGISNNFKILILIYTLAGIGFGVFHAISFASISRLTDKSNRGRIIGNFTAIGDLGRIGISAILTYLIVLAGWHLTAVIFGIAAITLSIIFILIRIKNGTQQTFHNPEIDLKLHYILKNKRLLYAITISFLDTFASSSLFIFLPFLLLLRGAQPSLLGAFTSVYFIGNLMGKTLLGRISDKHGNTKILVLSELVMVVSILFMTYIPSLIVIVITSLILGIVSKGTAPVFLTMITEAVQSHGNYEKVFGLNGIATGLANTIAPLLLGVISDIFGIETAFTVMAIFAISTIFPAFLFHNSKA